MDEHLNRKHQYENNFLTDVILRIDFASIDLHIEKIDEVKKDLSDFLPILQQIQSNNININLNDGTSKNETALMYKLIDKNSQPEKIFEFNKNYFAYTVKKYVSHGKFEEDISRVITSFKDQFNDLNIKRVGFRFINQIHLEQKEPYAMDGFINDKLISIFNFNPLDKPILRSMNSTEYKLDSDTNLIFNYGLFNKNYPTQPLAKEFILDYDCYTTTIDKLEEINDFIAKSNKLMATYFESSIGDKLRKEELHEQSPGQE